MAKITGIGGIFLRTNQDKDLLSSFYEKQLGLLKRGEGINVQNGSHGAVISIAKDYDTFPTLRFTVDNIEEMIRELKEKKVEVIQEIEITDDGKYAKIKDTCGNEIELWEPNGKGYPSFTKEEERSMMGKC